MKVRFVSGPTTMPVAQNTPRTARGTHHAFAKWKMRTLTREAAPTARTDSRIEMGITVTILRHLKCLPNQPASNRINSAHLQRGDRVGRIRTIRGRHLSPSILCRTPGEAIVAFPERRTLRQHDLNGTYVRRAAILVRHLLRLASNVQPLAVEYEH